MKRGVFFCCLFLLGFGDIIEYSHVLNETACTALYSNETVYLSRNPVWAPWDEMLYKLFGDYLQRYMSNYSVMPPIDADVGYILNVYKPSSKPIVPNIAPNPKWMIAAMLLLNSDVGGGDVYFPRQKKKVAPECGKLIVFPNSYTHPVSIDPVRIGEMRFVVTWFQSQ